MQRLVLPDHQLDEDAALHRGRRVTFEALKVDLAMIPFLLIGGALGILILSKMPQKLFENIIQVIVVLCAVYLFF